MTRVTLLGTGGPRPDPDRAGPATLVDAGDQLFLIDAGRGVATQLVRAGRRTDELDAVFLTHLHFDHIGGLGDLIMASWNLRRGRPLPIYGPEGTKEVIEGILDVVYRRDVTFRRREEGLGDPWDQVVVREISPGDARLGDVSVTFDLVEHGSAALDLPAWEAFGYRIEHQDSSLTISGDAVPCPSVVRLARGADVLVMCAYLAAEEIRTPGDRFLTEHVIAGAPQAAQVAREAGVDRLALTHLRRKPPLVVERMVAETARSFGGPVTAGRDLLEVRV